MRNVLLRRILIKQTLDPLVLRFFVFAAPNLAEMAISPEAFSVSLRLRLYLVRLSSLNIFG